MRIGRRSAGETRWEKDNRLSRNPAPFIVLALGAALLAGLFLLFWLF
ncbi:MAG TPA: hypothetical protein VK896_08885 [Gaiellaceae bacterium]|nr:hypothetical protein [Gaiellaceae bacterium]